MQASGDPFGRIGWISAAAGAAFLVLALAVLWIGQPHEDAYILFKYAVNLASGEGIVFYPGGPHTEGATDFLYMLVVAGLTRLDGDPAVSAAVVNSVGAGAIVAAFLGMHRRFRPSDPEAARRADVVTLAYVLGLFPSLPFLASYFGFGVTSYSALSLWLFVLLYQGDPTSLPVVPVLSLLVGLWRPDGVIIGVTASVLALWASRSAGVLRRTSLAALASVIVGAAYFAWRARYFGELLPLPLYVKSASDSWVPGLGGNLRHLVYCTPLLVAIGAALVERPDRRLLAALAPTTALFAALFLAVQSQDVAHRFQAPFYLSVLAASYVLAMQRGVLTPRGTLVALVAMGASTGLVVATQGPKTWAYLWNDEYVESLPAQMAGLLDRDDTVAVTEAGRIPFFSSARFVDLVGLNDAEAARHGTDPAWLAAQAPDVVMFHQAHTLSLPVPEELVREVPCASLAAAMVPGADDAERVVQAAHAATLFLSGTDGYRCFVVRYLGAPDHLYGVRKAWEKSGTFIATLQGQGQKMSYFQARALARTPPSRDD